MGYNTDLTEWPAVGVPEVVKSLVDKLFSVLDTKSPGAGDKLADEIFAVDGVLDSSHRFEGAEGLWSDLRCSCGLEPDNLVDQLNDVYHLEIRTSRKDAWTMIASRSHEILKVYTDSYETSDLLMIGQLTVRLKSEEQKRGQFIARISLTDSQTAEPRIKLYKVWMVSGIITLCLQNDLINMWAIGRFGNDNSNF